MSSALSSTYRPLEKFEDHDDDLASSSASTDLFLADEHSIQTSSQRASKVVSWLIHGTLLTVSFSLFFFSIWREFHLDLICVNRHSTFSPALGASVPIQTVKFNGTLEYGSIYRGPPSLEIDAAWEHLTNGMGAFGVSYDDLKKMGREKDTDLVRYSERQGGKYMASLEVFHQLHCVNLIRQYLDKDYYIARSDQFPAFKDPPEFLRATHVDHCIEMLRQKLTCDADAGVITYRWVSVRDAPWPDFNTNHQCRNFEKLYTWGVENATPSFGEEMLKPEGVVGVTPP